MNVRELNADEVGLAFEAMAELRPHVKRDEFVPRVRAQQADGYRLVGCFLDGEEQAAGAAGFRIGDNLAWGHFMYVDDLVTRETSRKRGCAGALMQWLVEEARRQGCGQLHLDSGVHRFDAHRLYLKSGMRISSHHFQLELD